MKNCRMSFHSDYFALERRLGSQKNTFGLWRPSASEGWRVGCSNRLNAKAALMGKCHFQGKFVTFICLSRENRHATAMFHVASNRIWCCFLCIVATFTLYDLFSVYITQKREKKALENFMMNTYAHLQSNSQRMTKRPPLANSEHMRINGLQLNAAHRLMQKSVTHFGNSMWWKESY